jgi:hypothetical protein
MSLEEIFLSLTTEEKESDQAIAAGEAVTIGDESNG